jgi:hypothetical protein
MLFHRSRQRSTVVDGIVQSLTSIYGEMSVFRHIMLDLTYGKSLNEQHLRLK